MQRAASCRYSSPGRVMACTSTVSGAKNAVPAPPVPPAKCLCRDLRKRPRLSYYSAVAISTGTAVERVATYLKNANDCLVMARKTRNSSIQAQLTDLARQWTELAGER